MKQKKSWTGFHWRMAAILLLSGLMVCTQPLAVFAEEVNGQTTAESTPTPTPDPPPADPTPDPPANPTPEPSVSPTPDPNQNPPENPPANPAEDPNANPAEDPNANPAQDPNANPAEGAGVTGDPLPASEDAEKDAVSAPEEENTGDGEKEKEDEKEETDEEKAAREKEEAEKAGFFELRVLVEGDGKVRVRYAAEDGNVIDSLFSKDTKTPVRIKKETEVLLLHEEEKNSTFGEWKVNKGAIKISGDRFIMPEGEVEIQAVFKPLTAEGASKEAQEAIAKRPRRTNAQLLAEQHIQALPVPKRDFRFWTVEKNTQFVRNSMPIMDDIGNGGKTIAVLPANGMVNVLEEVDRTWLYVESGRARGFIPKDSFVSEGERNALLGSGGLYAELTVPEKDNKAFLWLKCTAEQTVIGKEFVTPAKDGANILESPNEGARVCGAMNEGNIGYLIQDVGDGWLYIESGDVRGFVLRKDLHTGQRARVEIRMAGGESAFTGCTQLVAPEENGATYYTLTSVKAGSPTNPVRETIIKSAEQCLGHPYVWGGTSLVSGCDCSGFVQELYAMYGMTIPRVAENQAEYGRQIPVDNALPGDLIFFAKDGYVYHVALYVGNDQTIEAFGVAQGIIRNRVDHANAVWATRVIQD